MTKKDASAAGEMAIVLRKPWFILPSFGKTAEE